jgi:PPOX class probable F420-dependent enzyme
MSRRAQIQMTPAEARSFLERSKTAILCSVGPDGAPHPMPMWYALDDAGAVLMTTFAKSQKVVNLRRDPRVSILVEDGESYQELRGVVIYGKAEIEPETERVLDVLTKVSSRYTGGGGSGPPAEALRQGLLATARKRVALRVAPERVVSWDHGKLGGVY